MLSNPRNSSVWGDWEYLPLLDFGIKLLNDIPSKRLNLAYLPTKELENLRVTYEESNLAISPLQILRGFAVLHLLSDGECNLKLNDLITKALLGISIRRWHTLHDDLEDLCTTYCKSLNRGVIRVYFEENPLLTFNTELMNLINKYYGSTDQMSESLLADGDDQNKNKVVQSMCFQVNPDGKTTVDEMNDKIKEASDGITEFVIRRDLAPEWRTRVVLVSSFNSTFYWKPSGSVIEVETFFYETCEKMVQTRSVIKAFRCNGLFRTTITDDGVRVIELDSETDHLKMYLFQPQTAFSGQFMRKLQSKHLKQYVSELSTLPERKSVVIPCFTIVSPVGLRSVFANCNPIYHYICKNRHPQYPYPCIARIFSPYKAELGFIYGKASGEYYGTSHIYPLWEYYHKSKMAIKIGKPEVKKKAEEKTTDIQCDQPTIKDVQENMKKSQGHEITNLKGQIMIIKNQAGITPTQYMIGILKYLKNS
ncbi:unnamed protein product [Thelazia callipaeda]|uniref:SERPIN domain-containing protein n=1 Tax=Thelazia callipaeda TaxID=103827 RepID=A0A0N5CNT6_THECL|nr:unnamed protein product [Thelazia callipaeda]